MATVMMAKTLQDKLATIMQYQYELRAGRQPKRESVMRSLLDDPEIAQWMDKMSRENCVDFTRFS